MKYLLLIPTILVILFFLLKLLFYALDMYDGRNLYKKEWETLRDCLFWIPTIIIVGVTLFLYLTI